METINWEKLLKEQYEQLIQDKKEKIKQYEQMENELKRLR